MAGHDGHAHGARPKARKVFFSEEKKQKTFISSGCSNIQAMAGKLRESERENPQPKTKKH